MFLAILIAAELTILEIFNSQEIFAIHTNVAIFFLYLGLLTSKPTRVQVACGGQNHPPRKRCSVYSRITGSCCGITTVAFYVRLQVTKLYSMGIQLVINLSYQIFQGQ